MNLFVPRVSSDTNPRDSLRVIKGIPRSDPGARTGSITHNTQVPKTPSGASRPGTIDWSLEDISDPALSVSAITRVSEAQSA